MKTILDIPKPKNAQHILWEHLMYTALSFFGTYAFLIFGPMLAESKSRKRQSEPLFTHIIGFMSEYPEIVLLFCGFIALITNFYVYWKNSKCKNVQKITLKNGLIHLKLVDLMFRKTKEISLPINKLSIIVKSETEFQKRETKKIKFVNKDDNKAIAVLPINHVIWSEKIKPIRIAIQYIQTLGVEKSKSHNEKKSPLSTLFK